MLTCLLVRLNMATMTKEERNGTLMDPEKLDVKTSIGNELGQHEDVGISKHGMRVHPQPSADPLDPLNWSKFKKHTILAIVMYL